MNNLDLLTGPDAHDLLTAALATSAGRLVKWQVTQVDHRPGEITTVAYRARVRWPDGERDDVLGASASERPTPIEAEVPGVLTLSDGRQQVAVWCLPHDPDLPGLASALDRSVPSRLLHSFGVNPAGLRTRLIAYRPRRRAVIEVSADAGRWFLKVLRPDEVAQLHQRHRLLHDAGVPVPRSLGWSDDGLLVLENLAGVGLRSILATSPAPAANHQMPPAEDVLGLLDRFPAPVADLPRRTPWSRLGDRYAAVIATALPAERERVRQLARTVTDGLAGTEPGTDAVHGDFYEAQLMVSGGRISGLLDVDTAGPGDRADDLACALAHCRALARSHPPSAAAATALAQQWRPAFERRVDPAQLRLREAGVLIALATGPHRVQRPDWEQATGRALDDVERALGQG